MKLHRIVMLVLAAAALLPGAARATGLLTCDSGDPSQWITQEVLAERLTAQGWQVRFIKEDGGCWEVYGTTPEGDRAEAYFHPVTGEKLLVSQRGRILFRADGLSGSGAGDTP